MKNTDRLAKAVRLAREIHSGTYRRDGKTPYFSHIRRVAELVRVIGGNENQIIAAYLHDTIENYKGNKTALAKRIGNEFGKTILRIVLALTKKEGAEYTYYINKIKRNRAVLRIKICDMIDNLSDAPTAKQKLKYAKALLKLVG